MARFVSPSMSRMIRNTAAKAGIGVGIFGTGYGFLTRVGHEGIGGAIFGSKYNRPKYYGAPSNFKLPYYRYRSSRFRRRYGRRYRKRYGFGRRRIFRSYRARRYY